MKRYLTLTNFNRKTFGCKAFKVSLNGGFTCPNIDGTVGTGGCIYCSSKGSGDFAGEKTDDLLTQFNKTKETLDKKWPVGKYIAYFQANTNTYAPVAQLRRIYYEALAFENVIGLSIATRPDAISDEVLELLTEINEKTYLTVELGLQSIHAETLKFINRGHDLECFTAMHAKLRERGIKTVVHIINGLPNETKEMMLATAQYINQIKPHGVKIHMLHVIKETALAALYETKKFHILTLYEYVDIVCDQLEILRSNVVIHRVTGDADPNLLIEPLWSLKKFCVMNEIDKELKRRKTYQGFNTSILNKARQILEESVQRNDFVIDATVGNGSDTLFLCNIAYYVFGFDIQEIAIANTKKHLAENEKKNFTLFHAPHETMSDKLIAHSGKIKAVLFNLGYLPGGNKSITTKAETTIAAIKSALTLLAENSVVLVVAYPHEEGKRESVEIMALKDVRIETHRNTSCENAPFLMVLRPH